MLSVASANNEWCAVGHVVVGAYDFAIVKQWVAIL